VLQCTLARTAVVRRVDDHTSRWLEQLDAVLVDAETLEWQDLPNLAVRQAGARGRSRAKSRSRNLRVCRVCKRDSFQARFYSKGLHGGNLCVECSTALREKRRVACACGCGVLARKNEKYATVACARRHRAAAAMEVK
jgi:hypothetical protein